MTGNPRNHAGFFHRFSLVLALMVFAVATTGWAADLSSAKADGWIGEKPDGYIGLVRNDAPPDVQALVRDVNERRRAEYERIAQRQGAPLSEVEKVGGMTAIEKTRPGHYIMDASGRWRKK